MLHVCYPYENGPFVVGPRALSAWFRWWCLWPILSYLMSVSYQEHHRNKISFELIILEHYAVPLHEIFRILHSDDSLKVFVCFNFEIWGNDRFTSLAFWQLFWLVFFKWPIWLLNDSFDTSDAHLVLTWECAWFDHDISTIWTFAVITKQDLFSFKTLLRCWYTSMLWESSVPLARDGWESGPVIHFW